MLLSAKKKKEKRKTNVRVGNKTAVNSNICVYGCCGGWTLVMSSKLLLVCFSVL